MSAASISSARIAWSASTLRFSAAASSSRERPSSSARISAGEGVDAGSAVASAVGSAVGSAVDSAVGSAVGSAVASASCVSSGAGSSGAASAGASAADSAGGSLSVTASEDAAISAISAPPVASSVAIAGAPVISSAAQVIAARMRSQNCFIFTPPMSIIIHLSFLIITSMHELDKRAAGINAGQRIGSLQVLG